MTIEIKDKNLSKILNNPQKLIKKVGLERAKQVKKRLNELKAVNNFKQYLDYNIGKPHRLEGDLNSFYSIRLNKNYRLIIEPMTASLDNKSLLSCDKINIKGVMDYHGGKYEWIIP